MKLRMKDEVSWVGKFLSHGLMKSIRNRIERLRTLSRPEEANHGLYVSEQQGEAEELINSSPAGNLEHLIHAKATKATKATKASECDEASSDMVKQLLHLIQERFDQELSLERCAAELHYHPSYVSRVFKKELGIAFGDYVVKYRMDIAKQLLEETALPLNEIAAKLQYAHTSAFIRAFRKLEGVTPGQYRQLRGRSELSTLC